MIQQSIMTTSSQLLNHNIINDTLNSIHTLYCVNCNRKLLDDLDGISYSIKLKCNRCKAKFVISKNDQ